MKSGFFAPKEIGTRDASVIYRSENFKYPKENFLMLTDKFAALVLTVFLIVAFFNVSGFASVQIHIPGPEGSVEFSEDSVVLPNGNIVVRDIRFGSSGGKFYSYNRSANLISDSPPEGGSSIGAVYLYNGATGLLISTLTGSVVGDQIGTDIFVLANGNYLVRSRFWGNGSAENVGAITFCSGETGCSGQVSAANSLVGSSSGDMDEGTVTVLSNGNYVVANSFWDNESLADVGAVVFCNGETGCVGEISTANSLFGTKESDRVGTVAALNNGNYVVGSAIWDNGEIVDAGALTWCSGTTGCTGAVSTENSLFGGSENSFIGAGVTAFSGGKYATVSSSWGGTVGLVAFCDNPNGCVGLVTGENSLTGSQPADRVGGSGVFELANGGFVIVSTAWNNGSIQRAGAVTFCPTIAECHGTVSTSNSLYGTATEDFIGWSGGILILPNGNYVVRSYRWRSNSVGAVTFCSGTTGCIGAVSTSNSLHGGNNSNAQVGRSGFVLPNGNYVVVSSFWNSETASDAGAVTFCSGTTGCTGEVSAANSLTGNAVNDRIGSDGNGNQILANGNFVINSSLAGLNDSGAVTFCSGTTGCPTGPITTGNSLMGFNDFDRVGLNGIVPLENGNYVVLSSEWNRFIPDLSGGGTLVTDAGAATLCSGTTGCNDWVSDKNSLVGTRNNDRVGNTAVSLGNRYVIESHEWDSDSAENAGAVTFCDGSKGCTGDVSAANSLIGSGENDFVGNGGVFSLPNGDYVVRSVSFNNSLINSGANPKGTGALTYGDGTNGTFGEINGDNSVLGKMPGNDYTFNFDPVNNQLVVDREEENILTLFRNIQTQPAPFDFDGDGRTDISIFRPSSGIWYVDQSTDGFLGIQHGLGSDILTPADFDGDGKTDIAVWRPDAPNSAAFYILNSSDFSLRVEIFGQTGDDPVIVGDWDGDGKADPAVYRDSAQGSQSVFYYLGSNNNPNNDITFLPWGTTGDKAVRGDFDGDGKPDPAIFRPSSGDWYISRSSDNSVVITNWGLSGDRLVPGDYDGDSKTDLAVYRPETGIWYVLRSLDGQFIFQKWGVSTDQPAPGDYDGDGRTDFAVFRPEEGVWYILENSSGNFRFEYFGLNGDISIPSSAVSN